MCKTHIHMCKLQCFERKTIALLPSDAMEAQPHQSLDNKEPPKDLGHSPKEELDKEPKRVRFGVSREAVNAALKARASQQPNPPKSQQPGQAKSLLILKSQQPHPPKSLQLIPKQPGRQAAQFLAAAAAKPTASVLFFCIL